MKRNKFQLKMQVNIKKKIINQVLFTCLLGVSGRGFERNLLTNPLMKHVASVWYLVNTDGWDPVTLILPPRHYFPT